MMKYSKKNLPDNRGKKNKYPFNLLKKKWDFFEWNNINERINIIVCAKYHGIKVTTRLVNNKLHIIRLGKYNG